MTFTAVGARLIAQGQVEEGLTLMRHSMDTHLAEGNELVHPGFLNGLAAAHGAAGQIDEGLALLAEALDALNKSGQRLYEVGAYIVLLTHLWKSLFMLRLHPSGYAQHERVLTRSS